MTSPGDTEDRFLPTDCPHCDGGIEYPESLGGQPIACPHCGATLDLPLSTASGTAGTPGLNASLLASRFEGRVCPAPVTLRYRLALFLVTLAMMLVPLAYLGLASLVLGALTWMGWRTVALLLGDGLGPGAAILLTTGAALILCLGSMVLFFLLKPWFAPARSRSAPITIHRQEEPLLFTFIDMISDTVGAPRPSQVDVDCRPNASAGYRRGFGGFFVSDFRLTLGLPLVSRLNARQLAGVLAHELGHFRQRVGFRASYLIRAMNHGLARVTHERDEWDLALERWASGANDGRIHLLGRAVRLGVGLSRAILGLGMFAGNAVSCGLLRQMELDADRCQIELGGSDAFRQTLHLVRGLRAVARDCYRDLREQWNRDHRLPDDFPSFLVTAAEAADRRALERLDPFDLSNPDSRHETASNLDLADPWDAHPSDRRRLTQAEEMAAPGLFTFEGDARSLLVDFPALCREATRLHYQRDLGLQPR
ncbi:MAG: M48 family metalloprotease [Verrucomicrobiales bacterium]|nr:M48 family metalloprotease [Verrucomicrobiales bacterium]